MFLPIIADLISSAVKSVAPEVFDVNGGRCSGNQGLEFGVVEHAEPRRLYHGGEAAEEGGGLEVGLALQTVASHVRYVD